jgi:general secretion pathway protein M
MNFFWNLQTRERLLVIGAAVVLLLMLVFLMVIDPQLARSARLDRQIRAAQSQLRDIQTESREYLRHKRVLDRINQQLTQQRTFSLFSRLEQLARQTGIRKQIQYMKPTVSTPNDLYREDAVEIKMEGVTLAQLIIYLDQVERSPQLLKIKRLSVKPQRQNRQMLSAVIRVSTFIPKTETRS